MEKGTWKWIKGRRVFIKDGQTPTEAIEEYKFQKLLGKEYTGISGKEAIDKLIKEKQGHVKGAFIREDIGDIDLIWGNSGMGLQHIIERRIKTNQDLDKVLNNMSETIEKGTLSLSKTKDEKLKVVLEHNDQRVIIGTEINKKEIQFVLSSYEIYE